jgi:hypothetical protein
VRRAAASTIGVVAGLAGAAALGWAALVKVQGDSLIAVEGEALADVVADVGGDRRSFHGDVTLVNRGKAGGVVHRVEGRVVGTPSGRVLVTRQGSRPPERGWWQSNCLVPGESCVAEVEVELDEPASGPVTVELDVHEVGRRLKVHRIVRLSVPVPAP